MSIETLSPAQSELIAALPKPALARLWQALLRYGTKADRRRSKKADKATLAARCEQLALRAQKGKAVHMSEFDGWPACHPDAEIASGDTDAQVKFLIARLHDTSARMEDQITCSRCRKLAALPTPEELAQLAAEEQAQIAAERVAIQQEPEPRKTRRKSGGSAPRRNKSRSNRGRVYQAAQPVEILMRYKGTDNVATLNTDGSVELNGATYPCPNEALKAINGKARVSDAWFRWKLASGEVIDTLRHSEGEEQPTPATDSQAA